MLLYITHRSTGYKCNKYNKYEKKHACNIEISRLINVLHFLDKYTLSLTNLCFTYKLMTYMQLKQAQKSLLYDGYSSYFYNATLIISEKNEKMFEFDIVYTLYSHGTNINTYVYSRNTDLLLLQPEFVTNYHIWTNDSFTIPSSVKVTNWGSKTDIHANTLNTVLSKLMFQNDLM